MRICIGLGFMFRSGLGFELLNWCLTYGVILYITIIILLYYILYIIHTHIYYILYIILYYTLYLILYSSFSSFLSPQLLSQSISSSLILYSSSSSYSSLPSPLPSPTFKVYVSVFIVGYLYLLDVYVLSSSQSHPLSIFHRDSDPACFIGVDG